MGSESFIPFRILPEDFRDFAFYSSS